MTTTNHDQLRLSVINFD